MSLLINAGTASSKSERQREREGERPRQLHARSKTTKLPHAKLLCPLCLSLSVCVTVSPPAPALPPVSLHSCSVVTLTLAAYLCSLMFDTQLETGLSERRWLVPNNISVRIGSIYFILKKWFPFRRGATINNVLAALTALLAFQSAITATIKHTDTGTSIHLPF